MKFTGIISGTLIVAATSFTTFNSAGHAVEQPPPMPLPGVELQVDRIPPIEKLGNGNYRLGDILVNKAERSITFPAQVNMDSGMLEYLIVHNKGKTHESLLRTLIDPYNLQIGLLLLGYEGADQRLAMQGDPATPRGDRVSIDISVNLGGKTVTVPADKWLMNKFNEEVKEVGAMHWVFSGSYVDFGRFMAQESGSIVAIWHDPVALIDNASPGGESNRIWFVKQGTVPPVGTPVKVTIKPEQ